jgi:hypothetical protein
MSVAVATNAAGEWQDHPDPGSTGLDGTLRALRALGAGPCRTPGTPTCCTWLCSAVVGEVRAAGPSGPGAVSTADVGLPGNGEPDPEFDEVLVRRLAQRYLRVVADHAAGRPVPEVWDLLLAPPPARPARLALAGANTLLGYDLVLAVVGTCTVLGRTPGSRERDGHHRLAALLGARGLDVVRHSGDGAEVEAAAGLGSPAARAAAWRRAEHLWTLRGRPAEAEVARAALDLAVHTSAVDLLTGAALPTGARSRRPIVP